MKTCPLSPAALWSLCLILLCRGALAQTGGQSGPFSYWISEEGKVTILECDEGVQGAVEIPAQIEGKPVTVISWQAFGWCFGLTSVTIPEGIVEVGEEAFTYCNALTSLTLPNTLTTIEGRAFSNCTKLTSLTLGTGVREIQDFAFQGCTGLMRITLPAGLTSLGSGVFEDCTELQSILVRAGPSQFSSEGGVLLDAGRTTVVLYPFGRQGPYTVPAGVTAIAPAAFSRCQGLTGVVLPAGLTSVGKDAFLNCRSVQSFTMSGNGTGFTTVDGVLFNAARSLLVAYPPARAGAYAVPSTVASISDGAFTGSMGLTNITLPAGLTEIGAYAFGDCDHLDGVVLPAGLAEMGGEAFAGCVALTSINVPAGLTHIPRRAFFSCWSLSSVTIPEGIVSIGEEAFKSDSALTEVDLPESLTEMGKGTFFACGFTSITIPDGVQVIPESAFEYCYLMEEVHLPRSLTTIGKRAFGACNYLTTVILPPLVNGMGPQAFTGFQLKRMVFTGPAPGSMTMQSVLSSSAEFTVYYLSRFSRTGFTSPQVESAFDPGKQHGRIHLRDDQ